MNSRLNNRLANREDRQGGIATYFENLKELVQINDGSRSFILKTVDCHDQSAPFNSEQETRIAITHLLSHMLTIGFHKLLMGSLLSELSSNFN